MKTILLVFVLIMAPLPRSDFHVYFMTKIIFFYFNKLAFGVWYIDIL